MRRILGVSVAVALAAATWGGLAGPAGAQPPAREDGGGLTAPLPASMAAARPIPWHAMHPDTPVAEPLPGDWAPVALVDPPNAADLAGQAMQRFGRTVWTVGRVLMTPWLFYRVP